MKKIAVLTRDCSGVNAALRAVVRTADLYNIEVWGVIKEYEGLMKGEFMVMNRRSVSGIIDRGGTVLRTKRFEEFKTQNGQKEAVRQIQKNGIEGLIVIGGNGSLTGAHVLASRYGIPVIGVPATIDNDINGINLSIGADTAVNVAVEALDKIRDTAMSMERIFVVEVMGRDCGYIALRVALAGGCEEVLVPEMDVDIDKMCDEIAEGNRKGKVSWIVIVAEGRAKAADIAEEIRKKTGLETRIAVLGHIQRGGRPSARDRILGARLGNYALELLRNGETDKCVFLSENKLASIPLEMAVQPKKIDVEPFYRLIKILT
ncbi:MAG: 6-phosphofructokinase [Candidatus Aminicenantes bacterium]|nr:6-phosphofructokinase [Candidatus Aminicenantes bacterium]